MSGSNYPIPLKRMELRGNVVDTVCSFEMVQEYVNIENIPIETVFLFPKDPQALISRLTCEFKLPDGTSRLIQTRIMPIPFEKYEDAFSEG
jgi:Vault protein inter-alpha-trypsin domain